MIDDLKKERCSRITTIGFVANVPLRRWTVLIFLCGILFLLRSMMTIILLTFIFTYLIYKLVQLIRKESECVNQTSFNRVVLDRCQLWYYLSHYQVCTDSFEPIPRNWLKSVTDFYQKADSKQ